MHTIQLALQSQIADVKGISIQQKAQERFGISTGKVHVTKVFTVQYDLTTEQIEAFAQDCLQDRITDSVLVDKLRDFSGFKSALAISKLAGVTDDEGISAQVALADYFNLQLDTQTQHIFTQELYYFEAELSEARLLTIAKRLLGNPLINHFQILTGAIAPQWNQLFVPTVKLSVNNEVAYINLEISDAELVELSKKQVLSLNLEEMKAIQAHYRNAKTVAHRQQLGLALMPTDCELEILAQTWSEHCKHKEFNAIIHYKNNETGEEKTVHSLFKTYIRAATERVRDSLLSKGNDWLVKIFTDNAGVVKASKNELFVWKVETHNSPSALDPYGGAITGILGNNRDPLGTGIGGGRLLFNTNVLCFGNPNYDKPLLTGQLHPRQILEGVVTGIKDGGNKSGVPTVNGSIVFDERYSGKPLVYCGTGGLMPYHYNGKNTWEKPIDANDRIFVVGGRVGKDGIHGATFSSLEIDEHSPQSAVQIGSPITQKKAMDFLIKAANMGLIKCSTDNGAGGLSSSIGELATISNGAVVYLDKVPLKYAGLRPWEIFVSESQERMTLVVENSQVEALQNLAKLMEVECTDIGFFTNNGFLDIRFEQTQVALLNMEFLHDGVPQKILFAEWNKPELEDIKISQNSDYTGILKQLLGTLNICSRESIIRQYDHEVKGKSIIKPLMGKRGKAPQDAAVMRLNFDTHEGVAVSNGILPRYGDIDAYEMSAGAFDEAIRQIISVGGELPNLENNDGIFWSVNDNFCVPDSVYDEKTNPDGKTKLAKLVQMCEALFDMATYFDIPLTSGKDSMKNDFKADGVKISVPPTILYSMAAKISDVRRVITAEFKAAGDLVYQLGETYSELGGSEFYKLENQLGARVPKVRKAEAKDLYIRFGQASRAGLIQSSHDLSDGGLAVAAAEAAFGSELGAELNVDAIDVFSELDLNEILFSESHSRFVVTVRPEDRTAFESIMGGRAFYLGVVTQEPILTIRYQGEIKASAPTEDLRNAWQSTTFI